MRDFCAEFCWICCAPDKATLKAENHALQCTTAGPYHAITSHLLGVGSVCGLGADLVGIHSISLAARYRFAACSSTLRRGLEKIGAARGQLFPSLCSLSLPLGDMSFLFPPWHSTQRMHLILFVGWTVMTHMMKFRKTKNRKLPLGYFWTHSINKTLLGLSLRVADILHHMKNVLRASRPGLLVGFLRILCNGLCTALRFHTEEFDHTCRIGCPDERNSLTHYNECPTLHSIFISLWRHATILPQRNHLLHDLITRVFMRSLQYGIVVLGFLDAFVCAHHKTPL